jgi:uncharacterized protein DUF3761
MRLILTAGFAAALAVAPASRPLPPHPTTAAYTTTAVWLRAGPALTADRLALLPQGAMVRVEQCTRSAYAVQFHALRGYIPEELLASQASAQAIGGGPGYINSPGQWIPSPTRTADGQAPSGATARCNDGAYSFSQSRSGTCSWHGGVTRWL